MFVIDNEYNEFCVFSRLSIYCTILFTFYNRFYKSTHDLYKKSEKFLISRSSFIGNIYNGLVKFILKRFFLNKIKIVLKYSLKQIIQPHYTFFH